MTIPTRIVMFWLPVQSSVFSCMLLFVVWSNYAPFPSILKAAPIEKRINCSFEIRSR